MKISSFDEDYNSSSVMWRGEVNSDVRNLMSSPLKSILSRDKSSYEKQKLNEVLNSISKLIASVLNVSTDDILLTSLPSSTDNCCQKENDLDMLAEAIKEKLLISAKSKKVNILTFSPSS